MVNRFYAVLLAMFITSIADAQQVGQLDLVTAYNLSRENYPSIKQKDLVKQTASISIDNLRKGFLPQLSFSGQATYQSDVTKVNVPLPGITIESPSKDQYKVVAEVNQLLYDGGMTRQQKEMQLMNASVEDQRIEVELYKVKERVSELYLGVLYLDEQLKQVDLIEADIQTGIKKMEAQVQNGVAFRSSLNMLKAELLKAGQRATELQATRKGLTDALSLFTGKEINDQTKFSRPGDVVKTSTGEITRPELSLFAEQQKLNGQYSKLITAKNLPKASLFGQAGYGRPGLNMLNNDFDLYYIGGIRFSWSLGGLYTRKKEKEQLAVNKKVIDIQKETFLLNTNAQLRQQQAEIDKLEQLVAADRSIIELRHSVTDAAKAQLENGVITANDYLKEINAEDQARQLLIMHEVQLLQAQIKYQTISGK